MVASAELRSEHPLGKAIVAHAKSIYLILGDAEGFSMEAGKGIYANVSGKNLLCGTEKYLKENGVSIPQQVRNTLDKQRNQGRASILVAIDGLCMGVIGLSDVMRPTASENHKIQYFPVLSYKFHGNNYVIYGMADSYNWCIGS